jgi:hypothetical protein
MKGQFPALIHLELGFDHYRSSGLRTPTLPDGFLGGSAPSLQSLKLDFIRFPALSKFLLSATHLVDLTLVNIPHSGFISPEAIVTCLSSLTCLERLSLEFESSLPRPDLVLRRSPTPTCTVLPALTRFRFKGVGKYLEDLVAWI